MNREAGSGGAGAVVAGAGPSDTKDQNAPVAPARVGWLRDVLGLGQIATDGWTPPPVPPRVSRKEREASERAELLVFRKRSKAERRRSR